MSSDPTSATEELAEIRDSLKRNGKSSFAMAALFLPTVLLGFLIIISDIPYRPAFLYIWIAVLGYMIYRVQKKSPESQSCVIPLKFRTHVVETENRPLVRFTARLGMYICFTFFFLFELDREGWISLGGYSSIIIWSVFPSLGLTLANQYFSKFGMQMGVFCIVGSAAYLLTREGALISELPRSTLTITYQGMRPSGQYERVVDYLVESPSISQPIRIFISDHDQERFEALAPEAFKKPPDHS